MRSFLIALLPVVVLMCTACGSQSGKTAELDSLCFEILVDTLCDTDSIIMLEQQQAIDTLRNQVKANDNEVKGGAWEANKNDSTY